MGDIVELPGRDAEYWRRDVDVWLTQCLRQSGEFGEEVIAWIVAEWNRRSGTSLHFPEVAPVFPEGTPPEAVEIAAASRKDERDGYHRILLNFGAQLLIAIIELSAMQFAVPPPDEKTKARIFALIIGGREHDDGERP